MPRTLLIALMMSGCLYDRREGDVAPECHDGRDGDADGALDCAETDCAWTRFCGGDTGGSISPGGGTVNHPLDQPPVPVVGPAYLLANPGDDLTLDGSASFDPDGDALGFTWRIVSAPPTTRSGLRDPTHAIAHARLDRYGLWVFELAVVADGVTVQKRRTVDVATGNQPPWADAGPDQEMFGGDTVLLNGRSSGDPDGDPLTFQWTIVSQPPRAQATLVTEPSLSYATFVPDALGTYVFELVVDDGGLRSDPARATLTVPR